ncbi:MAG TPA: SRPBCC family protein [Acidimicrobiales bacterium]|nr:SRPBCC family protein [Acidimicrobiales bacterium]
MDPSTYRPSPLATTEAHPDGDGWTLVFVRDLDHPREKVWAALTDPARLDRWAPWAADRDLGAVGDAVLTMVDGDTREAMPAAVTLAERPVLLEYTLGGDRLRWELAATATGTRLTLRHTVAGPDWVPKVAAGWHVCLDVAEMLLDGEPVEAVRGRAAMDYGWQDLHDAYAGALGVGSAGS